MTPDAPWFSALESELDALEAQGLARRLRRARPAGGGRVEIDGRPLVPFASNDYLGLSRHPEVLAAAREALERYGAGAGAARLVGGGSLDLHLDLEAELARFKGAPGALVYSAGALANLGVLSALAGPGDRVILDKASHATLYDGARLSGARLERFPHQDLDRLERLLAEDRPGRTFVVVEGVYSMDGDVAPLPEILALAGRRGAVVVCDEAHATGVLGDTGRGALERWGLPFPEHLVLTGTLSKALGSLGGFAAGPPAVLRTLVQRSRTFLYATALPPASAAAARAALGLLASGRAPLATLRANRERLASGLRERGHAVGASESPILPVRCADAPASLAAERRLAEAGYYVPAMRPPTVPPNACRLRFTVTAGHAPAQIDGVLAALGEAGC